MNMLQVILIQKCLILLNICKYNKYDLKINSLLLLITLKSLIVIDIIVNIITISDLFIY